MEFATKFISAAANALIGGALSDKPVKNTEAQEEHDEQEQEQPYPHPPQPQPQPQEKASSNGSRTLHQKKAVRATAAVTVVSHYVPRITAKTEDGTVLRFTIENINVSLANALRRIILSEIPTLVFRTFPHADNKANISINTTRLHNEIIKQRLSCIPIHISDITEFPYKDYELVVDVENNSDTIKYVTTKDFRIRNKSSGNYLSDTKVREIFPPNRITGDYIIFARLMPKMTEYNDGEHLGLTADFDIGYARQDGAYSVVSACAYAMTVDAAKVHEAWAVKEAEFVKEGIEAGSDAMKDEKKNWLLLDGQRCTKENSFDFMVQSIGVYTNAQLVQMAAQIMIDKCNKIAADVMSGDDEIVNATATLQHGFDIEMKGEDYTLGKALEYMIYEKHYLTDKTVTYVAFRKVHPHSPDGMLRIGFAENVDSAFAASYVTQAAKDLVAIYEHVRDWEF